MSLLSGHFETGFTGAEKGADGQTLAGYNIDTRKEPVEVQVRGMGIIIARIR